MGTSEPQAKFELDIVESSPGILEFRKKSDSAVLAIVISSPPRPEGIKFVTSHSSQFQIGLMGWGAGHRIPAHSHRVIPRKIDRTSEVLFIRKGKVKMSLFTDDGDLLTNSTLSAGDIVTLFEGGHGFEILEDAEIVEIKQGPYLGEDEKYRFESDKQ